MPFLCGLSLGHNVVIQNSLASLEDLVAPSDFFKVENLDHNLFS